MMIETGSVCPRCMEECDMSWLPNTASVLCLFLI